MDPWVRTEYAQERPTVSRAFIFMVQEGTGGRLKAYDRGSTATHLFFGIEKRVMYKGMTLKHRLDLM